MNLTSKLVVLLLPDSSEPRKLKKKKHCSTESPTLVIYLYIGDEILPQLYSFLFQKAMKSGFSLNNQYFYLKGASKSCQIHRNFKPHLGCFNPLVASPFPPARFGLRGRELVGEIVGFEAGDPMRPRVRCGSKIVTASVGHLEHNNQPTTTTITTNQQQPTNKIESGWVLTWLWLWVMGMILVSCWRKVVGVTWVIFP